MFFRPVLAGAVIGTVAAGSAARASERRHQNMALQEEVAYANAQARAAQDEANKARREAERAAETNARPKQAQVINQAVNSNVQVTIPYGVIPGQNFNINYNNQNYTITCPASAQGGQTITVYLPAPQAQAQVVAVATGTPIQAAPVPAFSYSSPPAVSVTPTPPAFAPPVLDGKDLFNLSLSSNNYERFVLTMDHLVDETDPRISSHGIIAAFKGDIVYLLEGDLQNGLGGVYKDYVLVELVNSGRRGKISRMVLEPAPPPPPAITGSELPPPPAMGSW
mmetsp:Transcript_25469/g.31273  ORF Transcript_25469/g.31273 Transcript_25469/m.31273 type:complete len:280 (-) Transcript_25469:1596-2435(-)|eukprot:CAMPEP_0204824660 /NCGR_PEP_ID=MMETSP1346-20131115/2656_1 /ASSEMBLY_ACC=CAM_ASM_000771 /TAXON_ID=215587 /ORGANISM="Aplanochytrium stocchinoi, Strain GSBS06" /LENGTH=279 /DNA_ID=CAMNT_0051951931 /DNA_START=56 /DNA_END=895 /DNA_ORIENTATION=-